jgi:hypothetical protein
MGLVLAEAATLSSPLAGEGMPQIAGAAMDATRRPSVVAQRPDLPRDIDAVFLRATRPSSGERFADAAEMRAALRGAFGVQAPLAFTVAPPTPQLLGAPIPSGPPPGASLTQTPNNAGGGMIPIAGPPGATPGSITTHAPTQHVTMQPAARSGPHPLSIAALVVGVCALVAVLGLAGAAIFFLRGEREPLAAAPAAPPSAPAAQAPTTAAPGAVAPHPASPTPPSSHAGSSGATPPGPAPQPSPTPPPGPKPGDPRVSISVSMANFFDPQELKQLAESHRGEIVACYKSTLAHDARFRGTATVTVFNTLGAQDCRFDNRKDDESEVLCGCVRSAISGWKIPRPSTGSALFEYIFLFAP